MISILNATDKTPMVEMPLTLVFRGLCGIFVLWLREMAFCREILCSDLLCMFFGAHVEQPSRDLIYKMFSLREFQFLSSI